MSDWHLTHIPFKKRIGGPKKALKELQELGVPEFKVIGISSDGILANFKEEDYDKYVAMIYNSDFYHNKMDYDRIRKAYGERNTFDASLRKQGIK